MLLEVCCDCLAGAIAARDGGAQRVELCAALELGGLTPSHGLIKSVRAALDRIPLHVLVRPRGGDFIYTRHEMQVIREDIAAAKALGADGVVCGCLEAGGSVDLKGTAEIYRQCKILGLSMTFHRAFDMVKDRRQALDQLMQLGIQRLLTSGGEASAHEGSAAIAALVKQAAKSIVVIAGGGVRSHNVVQLIAATGVTEVHSSARRRVESSATFAKPHMTLVASAAPSDTFWWEAGEEEVKELVSALKSRNEGDVDSSNKLNLE